MAGGVRFLVFFDDAKCKAARELSSKGDGMHTSSAPGAFYADFNPDDNLPILHVLRSSRLLPAKDAFTHSAASRNFDSDAPSNLQVARQYLVDWQCMPCRHGNTPC